MRLAPRPGGVGGMRREVWTRESPVWFWVTFLALLLIALIAGAIVLAATDDDGEKRPTTAAQPGPTTSVISIPTDLTTGTLPGTVTIPTLGTTTTPTPTLGTTTTANGATTTPTTTGTTTGGTITSWPAGQHGYTIILSSVPKGQGRAAAEAKAREAIADGLPEVGILDSNRYTSLTQGYWVVFTGIYDTETEARNALPAARQAGWPVAYLAEVTPD